MATNFDIQIKFDGLFWLSLAIVAMIVFLCLSGALQKIKIRKDEAILRR